jgi:two-component system alkaline phosphatase synthesis response regulator PhoP
MTRIVIVEDDPMISEIYKKKFSEAKFEVFTATTGEEVLNLAKKEKVDVILLDLIMPKMDGFEVTKNLRSGQYDPNIKIIIFSNLNQTEDKEKAMDLGANGFIAKSNYNPSELVAEVERLSNQLEEQKKNEIKKMEIKKKKEKKEF